jgi:hypothetical protein
METNYKLHYERTVAQLRDVREDLRIANAKLDEDPQRKWVVGSARDSKIDRQRKALRELNRRVRVQRLQLRKLNELERGLRADEWAALKEEFAHELAEDDWAIEE